MERQGGKEVLVSVDHVTKRFGPVVALEDVSVVAREGEFVSILGPSGCGKTTLLRIIAGFEKANSGRVFIGGEDISDVPAHKRPVNMVFQRYALFPHRNVYENIAFGPMIKRWPKEKIERRVKDMLALVRLDGFEERRSDQLSGGQAQRIALARALINEPKVLLLDEPLGALDLKLRKAMQLELRTIQEQLKVTFIYVTHDQEEALTMSDRIVIMNEGRVMQVGSPTDTYNRPNNVFCSQFIGEANLFQGIITGRKATALVIRCGGLNILAPDRLDVEIGREAWVAIRPERIRIYEAAEKRAEGETDGEDNVYRGRIVNHIFLGPFAHYQVELGENRIVTVQESMLGYAPLHEVGKEVVIAWEIANSFLLLS